MRFKLLKELSEIKEECKELITNLIRNDTSKIVYVFDKNITIHAPTGKNVYLEIGDKMIVNGEVTNPEAYFTIILDDETRNILLTKSKEFEEEQKIKMLKRNVEVARTNLNVLKEAIKG